MTTASNSSAWSARPSRPTPSKGRTWVQFITALTEVTGQSIRALVTIAWGFDRMAKHEYEESIEEMKHADKIIDRILMLEGLPNLQDLGKLLIGENAIEVLSCDLKLEIGSAVVLRDAIQHCESVRDYVTRDLLTDILDDTEEHIEYLETQIDLVGQVGGEALLFDLFLE